MKGELWLRTANIPAALLVGLILRCFPTYFIYNHDFRFFFQVIESFMRSHGKHILDNYADSLLAVFQKLISSKALDQYGFQLANIFLHYVNVCVFYMNIK